MAKIPKIREYLDTDLEATLQGDPAALNKDEIVLSYPGLYAITVYRMAHELFLLDVPLIPRMMTEHAHNKTGIDIHPGATIGTLSTSGGQSLRGIKRHPTIEDYVTLYSGASILGGDTIIGAHSVIGSNAFITSSIPEGTKVSIKNQELSYKTKKSGETTLKAKDLKPDSDWVKFK